MCYLYRDSHTVSVSLSCLSFSLSLCAVPIIEEMKAPVADYDSAIDVFQSLYKFEVDMVTSLSTLVSSAREAGKYFY
jgi:ferritin